MNKNSYKYTQFLKLIADNTKFMQKLERKNLEKSKKPNLLILVPMNILSNNEYIKSIKNELNLLSLPQELISNNKFSFKIEYLNTKIVKNINCPITKENISKDQNEIKNIKVEYWLKYDNASEEAQRKHDKNNKQ